MPRGRGRPAGFRMSDEHRNKIANSLLVSKLLNHALDPEKHPMTSSQIKVSLALLDKVLPNLKAVELTGREGGALEVASYDMNILKKLGREERETFIRLIQLLESSKAEQEEKEDDTES